MTGLRTPLFVRIGPVKDRAGVPVRSQEGVRVNLLLTTLASQDTFFGLAGSPTFDWPNPRGYPEQRSRRTWTNSTSLLLRDTFFGLAGHPNYDWPNPRGAARGVSLRTWIDQRNLSLYSPAAFLTGGRPQYDWPNPRGARRANSLLTNIQQRNSLPYGAGRTFGYYLC